MSLCGLLHNSTYKLNSGNILATPQLPSAATSRNKMKLHKLIGNIQYVQYS